MGYVYLYFRMRESLITASINIAKGIFHFKPRDQLPSKPYHCEEYLTRVEFALQRADLIQVLS